MSPFFVVVEDHAKQMRIIFFEREQFLLGGFMFRFFLAFFERVWMRVRGVGGSSSCMLAYLK